MDAEVALEDVHADAGEGELGEFSPLEVVRAGAWSRTVFTTYALSLGFFEAVVLEALTRQKSTSPLILADLDGVRSTLAEHGARRVGRDYDLEPVQVAGGVFHPKVCALEALDDAHLIVGSGNLTFGGWGANLECMDHLHPSFAGDAFVDAADFFRAIATDPRLTHEAAGRLDASASGLERAGAAGRRDGKIRLVNSLAGGVANQIAALARELGGAQRITAASPFWDGGAGLAGLCEEVGLDHAYVHAHPDGVVEGRFGANWPRNPSIGVRPVTIVWLCEAASKRRLHAKLFEIICARGRVLVSGSANATTAGLGSGRNVEACVVRVSREPHIGWALQPSAPLPPAIAMPLDVEESESIQGVLRAELAGDQVAGRVLTDFPVGGATAWLVGGEGRRELAETVVAPDGRFAFGSETLEMEAWTAGRLILRLECGDCSAEGFIAFSDLQEVRRRAGPLAAKLLAVLGRTDTPADAAAMMAWFHEHPEHLTQSGRAGGGWGGEGRTDGVTNVVALLAPARNASTYAPGPSVPVGAGWKRFMDAIFAALSTPRAPFEPRDGSDFDDDMGDEGIARLDARARAEAARRSAAIARTLSLFDAVFNKMMARPGPDLHVAGVFALTQYVCDRVGLDEGRTRACLEALVEAFVQDPDPSDLQVASAAVMLAALVEPAEVPAARRARRRLLALGWPMSGLAPDIDLAAGFRRRLRSPPDAIGLWRKVTSVTTPQEEVKAYRTALEAGRLPANVPLLEASEVWDDLVGAIGTDPARRKIRFLPRNGRTCPCQSNLLPSSVLYELKHSWVAKAPCGHVLLCEEA
ncbi:MAG: hypothetical protein Q8Q88_21945 [Phenylobacterium sp.]|uniref:hypothetical protein n=1 Tax=Phenylobacterium sp. TaxID=1871053 RepID=UPI0027376371|nr:hypothetical protein [Phenylobacterium sp.]MDP3749702.1 hypothetical protein [Phenylobacterium sp.]